MDSAAYWREQRGKGTPVVLGGKEFRASVAGPWYALGFECPEWHVSFAWSDEQAQPPVLVQFRSEALWCVGLDELWSRFREWLAAFGLEYVESKTSRVDLACDADFHDWSSLDRGTIVCRAQHGASYWIGRKDTGFTLGKGSTRVRVYDKTEELRSSGKAFFRATWGEAGWGGESRVWRLEFQVRGETLREFNGGDRSWETVRGSLPAIWSYLVTGWLWISAESEGRTDGRSVSPFWALYQRAWAADVAPAKRARVVRVNLEARLDRLVHSMAAIRALAGVQMEGIQLPDIVWLDMSRSRVNYVELVERKRRAVLRVVERGAGAVAG